MTWEEAKEGLSRREPLTRASWPDDVIIFIEVPNEHHTKGAIVWFLSNGAFPLELWQKMAELPAPEKKPFYVRTLAPELPSSSGYVAHCAEGWLPSDEDKQATDWELSQQPIR